MINTRTHNEPPTLPCHLAKPRSVLWIGSLVGAVLLSLAVTKSSHAGDVDLAVGADRFPGADAVVLRWEQHWTIEDNGAVRYRDHKWTKLFNARPIRALADPRIDFQQDEDSVLIHAAQTHLPDGRVIPVPDYGLSMAAPRDIAGWPIHADWRQRVVSYSGIEPGCVVELDYEVTTRLGVLPLVDADLRLSGKYPTIERVVTVTVPKGLIIHHLLDDAESNIKTAAGTYRWVFTDLPASGNEPQATPWQQRAGRLRFTTAPSAAVSVAYVLSQVDQAARVDDAIRSWAQRVVEDSATPREKIEKLADHLVNTFNFISSPKAMRSLTCRPAGDVLRTNYGNPLESAALLMAGLRAIGAPTEAVVAVGATTWDERVPTASSFSGVVVITGTDDGPMRIHPHHGILDNPGTWGRRWLLTTDAAGALVKTYLASRGESSPSLFDVDGKLTVDAKGQVSGDLTFHLTGACYNPRTLKDAAAQKSFADKLVNRLLTGFKVTGHSIATLSEESLRLSVSVASIDALKAYGGQRVLQFGDGPAFLSDFPLPLNRSYRSTPVRIAGRVRETVNLSIELPDGLSPSVVPVSIGLTRGAWGEMGQEVIVDGAIVRLRRVCNIRAETISADEFATLRDAVNLMRTNSALTLAYGS